MGDVIQVVGWDGEHRAEAEILDPVFVQGIQLAQVFGGDGTLVIAAAVGDAVLQGGYSGTQVDYQVGRGRNSVSTRYSSR